MHCLTLETIKQVTFKYFSLWDTGQLSVVSTIRKQKTAERGHWSFQQPRFQPLECTIGTRSYAEFQYNDNVLVLPSMFWRTMRNAVSPWSNAESHLEFIVHSWNASEERIQHLVSVLANYYCKWHQINSTWIMSYSHSFSFSETPFIDLGILEKYKLIIANISCLFTPCWAFH